jgi:phospholipid/cholesterol/gamma-HCH transport system permease protein
LSFIAILSLDFVIGLAWNNIYRSLFPQAQGLL